MRYITEEMLAFLAGIRANNTKEWFEPRKAAYQETVCAPLKALGEALFAPYADRPGMMHKAARIYRDAQFPPYLHYRDTMWIYVRREAMYWSRTPSLFFEVSPEGARFGMRMSAPQPAFMAYLRDIWTEDAAPFVEMVEALEAQGLPLTGDEYKRPKPCPDEALLPYFKKKALTVETTLPPGDVLFGDDLAAQVLTVFDAVLPLHDWLWQQLDAFTAAQSAPPDAAPKGTPKDEPPLIQAPKDDFMW